MNLRRAILSDVEEMMALINHFADQGLMLPRSRNSLYECLREFLVVEDEGRVVATGALHIIWDDLSEIRALAVMEEYQGKGLGRSLVKALIDDAQTIGCPKVFTLTYQPVFFERCGFAMIDKEDMPHKVWKECIHCVKFPNCDENAMMLNLTKQ
ncbi:acetyltransferase, N-acetylglutamate synthase [Desulfitobacterium dichloroeliminans LMG P-21439]|uniref:Acetyltransferase, N-acetylglutamate synthase n=1 Tax=Desulfitobacterium dichloroeliminans (strain LMG P-21439 / DCA1) TaxID=871963 RepID=L0F8T2_DESDL|nr:N-acetyltransferase [Desulfitobacterium dichloroeliminans]AGA69602.1 acetyltransferase, N-acetylglutamate synthase [Desulfitobacterium dichloroeliminans LMG P-21439]